MPFAIKFLSTPSARRATDSEGKKELTLDISIHALREEGDDMQNPATSIKSDFYPRPPRGGRRSRLAKIIGHALFLSTPSARRATIFAFAPMECGLISIHALREEGDGRSLWYYWIAKNFYPRPPRGGRHVLSLRTSQLTKFLSTPSARRATRKFDYNKLEV